jgi:hypothetical protein
MTTIEKGASSCGILFGSVVVSLVTKFVTIFVLDYEVFLGVLVT